MSTKSNKRARRRKKTRASNRGFSKRPVKRRVRKLAKLALRVASESNGLIPQDRHAFHEIMKASNVTIRKGKRRRTRPAHWH